MRENIFRVWCKNKEEWEKDPYLLLPNGELVDARFYTSSSRKTMNPETHIIEFYTGRKDKDGRGIYAGDIIEVFGRDKYEIFWDEDTIRFAMRKKMGYGYFHHVGIKDEIKIVGNIHENQSLLAG